MKIILVVYDVVATPDPRTCAIYYFLTAVFVLLVAFDTFFALPMLVSPTMLCVVLNVGLIFKQYISILNSEVFYCSKCLYVIMPFYCCKFVCCVACSRSSNTTLARPRQIRRSMMTEILLRTTFIYTGLCLKRSVVYCGFCTWRLC